MGVIGVEALAGPQAIFKERNYYLMFGKLMSLDYIHICIYILVQQFCLIYGKVKRLILKYAKIKNINSFE